MHCVVLDRGRQGTGKSWLINKDQLEYFCFHWFREGRDMGQLCSGKTSNEKIYSHTSHRI